MPRPTKPCFSATRLKLTATLGETKMAALIGTADADDAPARITAAIDAMIEPMLASMDAARSAARKAVDTPGEVEKLEAPCNESL
jgi:hypothetical protein